MANVKISELPIVTSAGNSDVLPMVVSSTTSQLSLKNLANSLPQVTSSLSASFVSSASTAISSSYAASSSLAVLATTASFTVSSSVSVSSSVAISSSFALTASYVSSVGSTFPYTGSAIISGSLIVTGSINTSTNTFANTATYARTFQPYNGQYGKTPLDPIDSNVTASAGISWWSTNQGAGVASFGPGAIDVVYYADQNLGQIGLVDQSTFNYWAGSLKFIRDNSLTDINSGKVPYNVLVTNNATLVDSSATISTLTSNGRVHVLGVTGSFLARDGVTLGSSITNTHYVSGSTTITGSVGVTGSLAVSSQSSTQTSVSFNNGHVVLSQVSSSLNFANDTAAAAGGVPLGGLYRNGSVVQIRTV